MLSKFQNPTHAPEAVWIVSLKMKQKIHGTKQKKKKKSTTTFIWVTGDLVCNALHYFSIKKSMKCVEVKWSVCFRFHDTLS